MKITDILTNFAAVKAAADAKWEAYDIEKLHEQACEYAQLIERKVKGSKPAA